MNSGDFVPIPAEFAGQRRKMRLRLMACWVMLTLAVLVAILVLLSVTGVFSDADRRLRQDINARLQSTGANMQTYLDQVTAQSLRLSSEAGREIENYLIQSGLSFEELNNRPACLGELQQELYALVDTTIQVAGCSGAYVIVDATANTQVPDAETSRSGIYLRCVNITGTTLVNSDVSYFRGVPEVARKKNLELHNRWNLEFDTSCIPGYSDLVGQEIGRPAEHYYWTERIPISDTWEEVILLCVPVVGNDKTVYGVCGVEVSSRFFQLYAPPQETEYGSMTTVFAPLEDGKLMLQKGLIGGVTGAYLDSPEDLTVHQSGSFNIYTGSRGRYVGEQQPVQISLEEDEYRQWVTAMLLPQEQYAAYSSESRRTLVLICGGVLFVLLTVSVLLYWHFLHAIGRMSGVKTREASVADDLQKLVNYVQDNPDAPLSVQETLPVQVQQALDHFIQRARLLSGEERQLLRHLAQGHELSRLHGETGLLRWTIHRRMKLLCENLGLASPDDVLLYVDFFRRSGCSDELKKI